METVIQLKLTRWTTGYRWGGSRRRCLETTQSSKAKQLIGLPAHASVSLHLTIADRSLERVIFASPLYSNAGKVTWYVTFNDRRRRRGVIRQYQKQTRTLFLPDREWQIRDDLHAYSSLLGSVAFPPLSSERSPLPGLLVGISAANTTSDTAGRISDRSESFERASAGDSGVFWLSRCRQ